MPESLNTKTFSNELRWISRMHTAFGTLKLNYSYDHIARRMWDCVQNCACSFHFTFNTKRVVTVENASVVINLDWDNCIGHSNGMKHAESRKTHVFHCFRLDCSMMNCYSLLVLLLHDATHQYDLWAGIARRRPGSLTWPDGSASWTEGLQLTIRRHGQNRISRRLDTYSGQWCFKILKMKSIIKIHQPNEYRFDGSSFRSIIYFMIFYTINEKTTRTGWEWLRIEKFDQPFLVIIRSDACSEHIPQRG